MAETMSVPGDILRAAIAVTGPVGKESVRWT